MWAHLLCGKVANVELLRLHYAGYAPPHIHPQLLQHLNFPGVVCLRQSHPAVRPCRKLSTVAVPVPLHHSFAVV